MRIKLALAGLASLLLAGCQSPGPVDNPIARNLTWFSYLNGDDIRKTCHPGSATRYRLVYNAVFNTQVRMYDVAAETGGGGALVDTRVVLRANLSQWFLTPDLFSPWDARQSFVKIDGPQFAALEAALVQSGFDGPPPVGAFLQSTDYYWVVTGCKDGRVVFNAWVNGTDRMAAISFPPLLLQADSTGVPMRWPEKLYLPPGGASGSSAAQYFQLQVSADGVSG